MRALDGFDWKGIAAELDDVGVPTVGSVLDRKQCRSLTALYDEDGRFRATVDMARHHFGVGQYRYFDHPLPDVVGDLPARPRYCCVTAAGDGTRYIATCTAISSFPLQVVGLDEPGADYTGGEFLVVENRMRAQSRATTSPIGQGEALVFTTRDRPVPSARGWSAASVRHGVSVLRSGRRNTLGLIFHDAA
jgi:hypothetical protein